MNKFYIDTQAIPWELISRPKVEAVVFRPQTKIYQALALMIWTRCMLYNLNLYKIYTPDP
jgi:hypothetical protein